MTSKLRPKSLVCWDWFPALRQDTFKKAEQFFEPESSDEKRWFPSPIGIETLADAARKRVSCEQDLRLYHHDAVEPRVESIIRCLAGIAGARDELHLGEFTRFENQSNYFWKPDGKGKGHVKVEDRPTFADKL